MKTVYIALIIGFFLLLMIILLIVISGSKKNDDTPTPSPDPNPDSNSDQSSTMTPTGVDVSTLSLSLPESTVQTSEKVRPQCGLTKNGTVLFVKVEAAKLYKDKTIDFTKLDSMLSKMPADQNAVVRLYFNGGKGENYMPEFITSASDYTERGSSLADWGSSTVQTEVKKLMKELVVHLRDNNKVMLFQWGVGFWSEFHVSGTDLVEGENWPSSAYLDELSSILKSNAGDLQMATSVGVGDKTRPISDTFRVDKRYGLFWDTFLQKNEDETEYIMGLYKNADFDGRKLTSMMGGEYSNKSPVLTDALLTLSQKGLKKRWMSYIMPNGSSTSKVMTSSPEKLQVLSDTCGYDMSIVKMGSKANKTELIVENTGIAPPYYDMYFYSGETRLEPSLRLLQPGKGVLVSGNAALSTLTIKGDRYAKDITFS